MRRSNTSIVYLLTGDIDRVSQLTALFRRYHLQLRALFPKDLPVPQDASALVVDLDFLWMDLHEMRRWVCSQLKQPLHHTMLVVSRNLDDFSTSLLEDEEISGCKSLDLACGDQCTPHAPREEEGLVPAP
jgi:hypothetical protein